MTCFALFFKNVAYFLIFCLFESLTLSIVSKNASIELAAKPIPDAAAAAADNPALPIEKAFPTGPAPETPCHAALNEFLIIFSILSAILSDALFNSSLLSFKASIPIFKAGLTNSSLIASKSLFLAILTPSSSQTIFIAPNNPV